MKRYFTAMIISLAVHGIAALTLSVFRYAAEEPRTVEISFSLPTKTTMDEPPKRTSPSIAPSRGIIELPPLITRDELAEVIVDSTADSLRVNRLDFFTHSTALKPFTLPDSQLQDAKLLKTPTFEKNKVAPLFSRPGPYDGVQSQIDRRNHGGERTVSLSDLAQAGNALLGAKKEDEKPVRLDFVPTKAEMEILSAVWEKSQVNDVEIYASLDSSVKVTAEEMQAILAKLVEKRMLSRKLISPQNEFTLPFGATVEMSAKNRRNRVWEYQARIDAQEVIRYLNALLYQLESAAGPRTIAQSRRIAELKEKILQAGR